MGEAEIPRARRQKERGSVGKMVSTLAASVPFGASLPAAMTFAECKGKGFRFQGRESSVPLECLNWLVTFMARGCQPQQRLPRVRLLIPGARLQTLRAFRFMCQYLETTRATRLVPVFLLLTTLAAAKAGEFAGFTYEDTGTTITITDYTGSRNAVVIPDAIMGKPVTSIANWAFQFRDRLTDVTISKTVTEIGDYTFDYCTELTAITVDPLNPAYASVEGVLFTKSQNTLIQFPAGKAQDYIIPNSVTTIADGAFSGCVLLTSLTIPKGVMTLGMGAFVGCAKMTDFTVDSLNPAFASVEGVLFNKNQDTLVRCPEGKAGNYNIPKGVISLGDSAFKSCTGLTNVTIPEGVTAIGESAFAGSGLTDAAIPDSVTSIGNWAFYGCDGLTSLTIPGSLQTVGSWAFENCRGLTTVVISEGVTSIGTGTFDSCTSLTNVIFASSVTNLGNSAFSGCSSLKVIEIPASVISIGDYAFGGCTTLTSVTLSQGVSLIDGSAFQGCTGLTGIIIPRSVTSIGPSAFSDCTGLTTIAVEPLSPAYTSVDGVLFAKNRGSLIQFPAGRVGDYVIPSGVTNIGGGAFDGCTGLTNVSIPNGVTTIRDSAFTGCTGLTSLALPNSIAEIGSLAFSGCVGLSSIVIPNGVTSVGDSAFAGCTGLTSLALPDSIAKIGSSAFRRCTRLSSMVIPTGVTSIELWVFRGCTGLTNVTIPDSVTNIGNSAFEDCASLTSITIPASVSNIGNGALLDCTGLASVSIPEGVTSIGASAFRGCAKLASVTIPANVTNIGSSAFRYDSGLTSITVDAQNPAYASAEGVLFNKGRDRLIQCPGAKKGDYSIPASVTTIGDSAFERCDGLTSVVVPASVTGIGRWAFLGCSGLTAISVDPLNPVYASAGGVLFNKEQDTLLQCPGGKTGEYIVPGSVTSIGEYAFNRCAGLTSVAVFSTLSEIGVAAFSRCGGLTAIMVDSLNPAYASVDGVLFNKSQDTIIQCPGGKVGTYTIPSNVSSIGSRAFEGCAGLTKVVIPASVTGIGDYAFRDCTWLMSAYFEGNAPRVISNFHQFDGAEHVTVYYRGETEGWPLWGDIPGDPKTALWVPQPPYNEWAKSTGLIDKYPNANGETDDPDQDRLANLDEMLAGTDPTNPESVLVLESLPRPEDLTEADRTAIDSTQHALYFRSVPGKTYAIEGTDRLGQKWQMEAVVSATTTQKRVLLDQPAAARFYRVMLAP